MDSLNIVHYCIPCNTLSPGGVRVKRNSLSSQGGCCLLMETGTSVPVQWLRLPSSAGAAGLIPGQNTEIPYAVQSKNK